MNLQGLQVLLIEDDELLCRSLSLFLGVYNRIHTASRWGDARHRLQTNRYDVVLVDKGLPDGLGQQFIPEIRRYSPESLVVVVTGDTDFVEVTECLNAGADDYVFKSSHLIQDLLLRLPLAWKHKKVEPSQPRQDPLPDTPKKLTARSHQDYLAKAEKEYLSRALKLCQSDVGKASRLLGMGRSTFFKKMAELGIARALVVVDEGRTHEPPA